MKTNKIIIPFVALGLAVVSCDDQMNYTEDVTKDKDYIESNFGRVGGFMTKLYKAVEYDFGQFNNGAMSACATDEAEYSQLGNTITDFYNGAWSPTNAHAGVWNNMYTAIQDANHYIDFWQGLEFKDYELDLNYNAQMHQYKNYYYEARFLRAYFYFTLNRYFGGVPILREDMSTSEMNSLARNTSDEVFKYIFDEIDAITGEDGIISNYSDLGEFALGSAETGRATRAAALALKARAALYWASPLFNPTNDTERYKYAAKCYEDLFEECKANKMKLAQKYSDLWGADNYSKPQTSREIIYGYRYGAISSPGDSYIESHSYPVGVQGGTGGNCPTQDLVDAYEMKNGKAINEEGSGYDKNDPYKNRDPRFAMTIAVNGDKWPTYSGTTPLEIFHGGLNGAPKTNATTTGYYLKKLCDGAINFAANSTYKKSKHTYLNFRYGGALLDFAEAMFKAYGDADAKPDGHTMSAREAVNEVRNRAGVKMPKITVSGDEFWAKLQNERRVELAFEGHRFWDVRRWKEGPKWFSSITRCEIEKNVDPEDETKVTYTYKYTKANRQWDDKYYFFPIPQTERMKNPNLEQNPGW